MAVRRKRRTKGLTDTSQFFTNYAVGHLVHSDTAIRLRIARTNEAKLAPAPEQAIGKPLRVIGLHDMRAHFFFGMAAHRIAQLLVLECKVEVHKLSLAPKDTYMRKASYLQNRMLRARI